MNGMIYFVVFMELTDYQKEIALKIMQAEDKGIAIRYIRENSDITQRELAGRMGCTQSVVADYEGGRRNPGREFIYRLSVALSEKGNGIKKRDLGFYPLGRHLKNPA